MTQSPETSPLSRIPNIKNTSNHVPNHAILFDVFVFYTLSHSQMCFAHVPMFTTQARMPLFPCKCHVMPCHAIEAQNPQETPDRYAKPRPASVLPCCKAPPILGRSTEKRRDQIQIIWKWEWREVRKRKLCKGRRMWMKLRVVRRTRQAKLIPDYPRVPPPSQIQSAQRLFH